VRRVRTLAILPVKRFGAAKQRLGERPGEPLSPDARRLLAEAMVADVLEALATVRGLSGMIVVTGEPRAGEMARAVGATLVDDPVDAGQSAAAGLGIAAALRAGAARVLLVPGDCPALDPAEVGALLEQARGAAPAATIVPDRHGEGTNALLLAPPGLLDPAFGPGSRARHETLARAAGAEPAIAALPSLALDVDTPDDLAALRAGLSARPGGAPRTRAVLEHLLAAEPARR
jgi:2-phospho-L-lactate guanylyltransferase